MTVEELIAELQKYYGELEVKILKDLNYNTRRIALIREHLVRDKETNTIKIGCILLD